MAANLLTVDDDVPRLVQHKHMDHDPQYAEPDDDGILRNEDGQAYSSGAYVIKGVADLVDDHPSTQDGDDDG